MTTLPSEPGFYWWRPSNWYGWKVLRVRHFGSHLNVDDVSEGSYMGRPLNYWEMFHHIGEWVKIEEPNTENGFNSCSASAHVTPVYALK